MKFLSFMTAFLVGSLAASLGSAATFNARFEGIVLGAYFSDTEVVGIDGLEEIDLSSYSSAELSYDDSYFTGLDTGEEVRGTISLKQDAQGSVSGECYFSNIIANFCGEDPFPIAQSNGSSVFSFADGYNQILTLIPTGVFGGSGSFYYEDDSGYDGFLPDGTQWFSGSNGGFSTNVEFTYQVVSEIPLPATAPLLLSVLLLPMLKRRKKRK